MSLYNELFGFSPACVVLLPMLGRESAEYPRFRDCFLSEDEQHIEIFTRVGGPNRGCGYGEEELYEDPNFVSTYDDDFDNTYGIYVFNVPQKWKTDFDLIVNSEASKVSNEYVEEVKKFYPNIDIDKFFGRKREDEE